MSYINKLTGSLVSKGHKSVTTGQQSNLHESFLGHKNVCNFKSKNVYLNFNTGLF